MLDLARETGLLAFTLRTIRDVLVAQRGVHAAPQVFGPGARLEAIGVDSLMREVLAGELEERLAIAIPASLSQGWETVADVVECAAQRCVASVWK